MDEGHNKFTEAEIVVGGLGTLFIDGVSFVLDFVPVVGWVIATILQAATSVGTSWWLQNKGGKRAWGFERQLIKQIANFLPWVPTCFAAFMIETTLHNHPKAVGAIAKVAGPAGKAAKKVINKAA